MCGICGICQPQPVSRHALEAAVGGLALYLERAAVNRLVGRGRDDPYGDVSFLTVADDDPELLRERDDRADGGERRVSISLATDASLSTSDYQPF